MSQSVIDTKAEPSEFHQIVNDPDKRLQWIYEHFGCTGLPGGQSVARVQRASPPKATDDG